MILSLGWLEEFSPMQIHWRQKWLSILYEGSIAVLLGNAPELPVGSVIQLCVVQSDDSLQQDPNLSPEIAALLQEFASLFHIPSALPPPRSRDHTIPLIEGAQPVFIRPYHYAPVLKTEIERQVQEMLD